MKDARDRAPGRERYAPHCRKRARYPADYDDEALACPSGAQGYACQTEGWPPVPVPRLRCHPTSTRGRWRLTRRSAPPVHARARRASVSGRRSWTSWACSHHNMASRVLHHRHASETCALTACARSYATTRPAARLNDVQFGCHGDGGKRNGALSSSHCRHNNARVRWSAPTVTATKHSARTAAAASPAPLRRCSARSLRA